MSNGQPAPFPGQSDKIVQVENLSKKYGENLAVNGISFSLTKGEVFAFLGPNGAGKTTTVEILECLRNPTGGQAKVLGRSEEHTSELQSLRHLVCRLLLEKKKSSCHKVSVAHAETTTT